MVRMGFEPMRLATLELETNSLDHSDIAPFVECSKTAISVPSPGLDGQGGVMSQVT